MIEIRPSQSSTIRSFIPTWIRENYETFVSFMSYATESENRVGFSADLLQNLDQYTDFNSYQNGVITENTLKFRIEEDDDQLELANSYGFPERDGILLIDDEVILYRQKEGNVLTGLYRGASGTTELTSYRKEGEYLDSTPAVHSANAVVHNLSSLFLSAILENIHKTYLSGIGSDNLSPQVNRGTLLKQIKSFFKAKGTQTGISTLFKMVFGEEGVEAEYPGDQILDPSESTWGESVIIRTTPTSPILSALQVNERYEPPTSMIGQILVVKSFNDDKTYGSFRCDYVSRYTIDSDDQFEINIDSTFDFKDVIVNPKTILTRDLEVAGSTTSVNIDVFTVTVQSTVGFPESGIIIIGDEAIQYESKSLNQFLNCKRGHIGVESLHLSGEAVHGPYYLESRREDEDGLVYVNRSFATGIVREVQVRDGGLFHSKYDSVESGYPGKVDPGEPILTSLQENYNYDLVRQATPDIRFVGNITHGINTVFFDYDHVFISSNKFPAYPIGPFSLDGSVGQEIEIENEIFTIPRRHAITETKFNTAKGTDTIGVFVDGVPAFSNVGGDNLIQGKITRYNIVDGGNGYVNPTVLIKPSNTRATARVVDGRIAEVRTTSVGVHTGEIPEVQIVSGIGAEFRLTFDHYGRVTDVFIENQGQYYYDAPSLKVYDSTNRGRGAVISCEVLDGKIIDVNIQNPGIDYDKNATYITVVPVGSGAVVTASVEYYRFDKYKFVLDDPNLTYDSGGGFLWADSKNSQINNRYGYICAPSGLRSQLNDDGNQHSPILGWAFDGNPIYGPYGYTNGKNPSGGVSRQKSGYFLLSDRKDVVPSGGSNTEIPLSPPSTAVYPMGTFVEDYRYIGLGGLVGENLLTEEYKDIQTEAYQDLQAEVVDQSNIDSDIQGPSVAFGFLDSNNGKICNTPEYPAEIYPDGIYAYFVTIDDLGNPAFPYILGENFTSNPISQNVDVVEHTSLPGEEVQVFSSTYHPESFSDIPLVLDFEKVERHRHPYLISDVSEIEMRIGELSRGSVSSFVVSEGGNSRRVKVGDLTYAEDGPIIGSGAEGVVTQLKGEKVITNESTYISSYLFVHRQRISLALTRQSGLVFVKGSYIETETGSRARVTDYDVNLNVLIVQTETERLIRYGDIFRDNRGVRVILPANRFVVPHDLKGAPTIISTTDMDGLITEESDVNFEVIQIESEQGLQYSMIGSEIIVGYLAPNFRPGGGKLLEGDMWYSTSSGRLYVWWAESGHQAWVCTQPINSVPMIGAADESIGLDSPHSNIIYHQSNNDNTITISDSAPLSRPDGSSNKVGDLWWSPHTGLLYTFYSEYITYVMEYWLENGHLPTDAPGPEWDLTTAWVCSDPAGKIPVGDYAVDDNSSVTGFGLSDGQQRTIFTGQLHCIVSPKAPLTDTFGNPVTVGNLWWSNLTGKMYIYYNDGSSTQWVVTNPAEAFNPNAPDGIIMEGGQSLLPGGGGPAFPEIPEDNSMVGLFFENADQEELFLSDYTDFHNLDVVEFMEGFPESWESAQIRHKREQGVGGHSESGTTRSTSSSASSEGDRITFLRGVRDTKAKILMNFIEVRNKSRFNYKIETDIPHNLREGDVVTITGSSIDRVNGKQVVHSAGKVKLAILEAGINPATGEITDVVIRDPGKGYEGNFEVDIRGDGGGARIIGIVDPIESGGDGGCRATYIMEPGSGYTYPPDLIATPYTGFSENTFFIQVIGEFEYEHNKIKYTTSSEHVTSYIDTIDVVANGSGYAQLPEVTGIVKREGDRATGKVQMDGTVITSVALTSGGNRYENPIAVFRDLSGNGTGAYGDPVVEDGVITDVEIYDGGGGYLEPVVDFIEKDDGVFADSNDIGKIKSIVVTNAGRNVPSDRSLKPEVIIDSKLIIQYDSYTSNLFVPGMFVWQGTRSNQIVTGIVKDYDEARHLMTVESTRGVWKKGMRIYSDYNVAQGLVVNTGQAEAAISVMGNSYPMGNFFNETSFLNSDFSYIQDSYYYQHFSYEITSTLRRNNYEKLVKEMIHPAGFIGFYRLDIREQLFSTCEVDEPDMNLNSVTVKLAGIDGEESLLGIETDSVNQVIVWNDR